MTFFTDLDNTLIYSHRWNLPDGKVCVEYLDGREQSYMTESAYTFLTGNPGFAIVPVTTRTEVQYGRLTCMEAMGIRHALICNGGKLLADGKEDVGWTRETMRLADPELPALHEAAVLLRGCADAALQEPEPYMIYARCEDPAAAYRELCAAINPQKICVAHDRRKVYLICRSVNKGAALQRFRQRFSVKYAIAAGDDPLDVPMLNEADFALAPESVANGIQHLRRSVLTGDIISDEICTRLKQITSSGPNHC